MKENHYACGYLPVYVSRVTEKVIVVVCNDVAEVQYRRDNGYPKGRERSGLASIGTPSITGRDVLEQFLKEHGELKNGVYVYDSGFRISKNSRDEIVRPEVKEAWEKACKDTNSGATTMVMLRNLGHTFIKLYK